MAAAIVGGELEQGRLTSDQKLSREIARLDRMRDRDTREGRKAIREVSEKRRKRAKEIAQFQKHLKKRGKRHWR